MTKREIISRGIFWYNFKTQKNDHLTETPQEFKDYIPQDGIAQNMYVSLIEMKWLPLNAALRVLEAIRKSTE